MHQEFGGGQAESWPRRLSGLVRRSNQTVKTDNNRSISRSELYRWGATRSAPSRKLTITLAARNRSNISCTLSGLRRATHAYGPRSAAEAGLARTQRSSGRRSIIIAVRRCACSQTVGVPMRNNNSNDASIAARLKKLPVSGESRRRALFSGFHVSLESRWNRAAF